MKKFYTFILLLLFVSSNAQSSRIAENFGIEVPGTAVAIGNKIYYTARMLRINGCCSDSVYVIGRTLNGLEVLRKFVYEAPNIDACGLVKTDDAKLLVKISSQYRSCDQIQANTQLVQLDTLGNINFSFNDYRDVNALVTTTGGGFLSFSANYLQQYNAQGQRTFTMITTLGTLSSAYEYSPSVYIGAFQTSAGPKLRIFNAQFVATAEVNTGVLLTNLQASADGGIIGYAGSTIYKYNQSLNLQHQYSVLNATISAYCTKNDSLYVAAYLSNGVPQYMRLDSSFALTHTGQSNLEKSIVTSLIKSKDNQLYALISTYKYYTSFSLAGGGINQNNQLGLYKTEVNGNLNSTHDIGVSSISVLMQQNSIPFNWPKGLLVVVKVGIRNYGTDTVKSFNVNTFLGSGGNTYCLFGLNQRFQKLIPPGDSVSVITDTFVSFISTQTPPATYTICVFSSVPDGQIDMDASNDQLCLPTANIYFSVSEAAHESLYSIFPSPVQSTLYVHCSEQVNRIDVINHMGVVVYSGTQIGQEIQGLDFSSYEPGIYFIRISTNDKCYYQKIIKEN